MDTNKEKEDSIRTFHINNRIKKYKKDGWSSKGISDGWHTFNDLYYHRMILFLALQLAHKDKSWKSKKHYDGSMFDDSFIVGIKTNEGDYTYHYNLKYWSFFENIKEIDKAPKYDGHNPEDIDRLLSLY